MEQQKIFQVKNLARGNVKKGRYLMDYSKKYGDPYDVCQKAKIHVQHMKQNNGGK